MSRRCLLASMLVVGLFIQAGSAGAMASRARKPTLLVVPAQYAQLQLAFDIANRYQAVLVAYQAGEARPLLHVWNGDRWIQISIDEFSSTSFMRIRPDRVILVGDEHMLPAALVDASAGSPNQYVIASADTATLVNHFGHFYRFRSTDWSWFAARYNLELADLNQARRKTSWYDRSARDVDINRTSEDRELQKAMVDMSEEKMGSSDMDAPSPRIESLPPVDMPPVNPRAAAEGEFPSVSEVQQSVSSSGPHKGAAGSTATGVPAGWQERAVATEAPVK